jgi:sialidase-1
MDENSFLLEKNFKAAGGNITVIVKEGIGHHPHSLKDPRPIVDFILRHTAPGLMDTPLTNDDFREITHRGSLLNSFTKFEQEKTGRVAFLGGSITTMQGWRDQVCNYLRERFPDTEFNFINAGIPSTGSVPGAFRLISDVFKNGPVDLLFEEAAVNDATNFRTSTAQIRGMEGIIRHARQLNPEIDIVMMHFADQDKMADYNQGKVPEVIQNHEQVAVYYHITCINLAKEVNNRILDGQFTWKDDFKDLHPSPFGQKLYFESIKATLEQEWAANKATTISVYPMPAPPLIPTLITMES